MSTLTASEIAGMRGTVEDVALMMTCTIERATAGPVDAYGQPTQTWAVLHAGIPCLYWVEDRATEAEIAGPNVGYVLAHQMVQLEANVDVREGDRVTSVVGVDGAVVASDLNIQEVRHRVTDTVLVVEEVR